MSVAPFGRRVARLVANDAVGGYRRLVVCDDRGPRPAPGQFYMLATVRGWGGGEGERPFLPRAFSHLRATARHGAVELEFALDDVGPGTHRLMEAAGGEELWLTGPLGRPFAPPPAGRAAVLVGGGIGIAPVLALADELSDAATVLLGFRDAGHAAGWEERGALATDDGSCGHHGPVTDLLRSALREAGEVEVFACGPPGMLEAVRELLAARAIPGQLALEAGMACGFGACFGCVVPTRSGLRRVCTDGPVFAASELDAVHAHG